MGPNTPGTDRAHPDQIVRAVSPLVDEAARELQNGVPPTVVLKETILAGFLVGTGMPVGSAGDLLRHWRSSGLSTELQRPPARGDRPPVRVSPTPPRGPGGSLIPRELMREIQRDMQDEGSAAALYRELMERAESEGTDPQVVEQIRHAAEDEERHYRMLGEMYRELSGHAFEARPERFRYDTLVEGLHLAINGEFAAHERYRDLYLATRNERVRDLYFELLTDELDHASRFNYILHLLAQRRVELAHARPADRVPPVAYPPWSPPDSGESGDLKAKQ